MAYDESKTLHPETTEESSYIRYEGVEYYKSDNVLVPHAIIASNFSSLRKKVVDFRLRAGHYVTGETQYLALPSGEFLAIIERFTNVEEAIKGVK